jgi:glycosyltransferase involved in cell wall biosynthesis
MLTVIIPAYNAHRFIDRAVASVAAQSMARDIKLIIVNDGSSKNYSETIKKFSSALNIEEIHIGVNSGVSFARQVGLNTVQTEYVTFLDADDFYVEPLALEEMVKNLIKNTNAIFIDGDIIQENRDKSANIERNTQFWVFPKVYRMSIIKDRKINFKKIKVAEDYMFNIEIVLKANKGEGVLKYNAPSYYWTYNENSLSRVNESEVWFHQDLICIMDALTEMKYDDLIQKDSLNNFSYRYLFITFHRYMDNKNLRPKEKWGEEVLSRFKKFYKEFEIEKYYLSLSDSNIMEELKIAEKPHNKDSYTLEDFYSFIKKLRG